MDARAVHEPRRRGEGVAAKRFGAHGAHGRHRGVDGGCVGGINRLPQPSSPTHQCPTARTRLRSPWPARGPVPRGGGGDGGGPLGHAKHDPPGGEPHYAPPPPPAQPHSKARPPPQHALQPRTLQQRCAPCPRIPAVALPAVICPNLALRYCSPLPAIHDQTKLCRHCGHAGAGWRRRRRQRQRQARGRVLVLPWQRQRGRGAGGERRGRGGLRLGVPRAGRGRTPQDSSTLPGRQAAQSASLV